MGEAQQRAIGQGGRRAHMRAGCIGLATPSRARMDARTRPPADAPHALPSCATHRARRSSARRRRSTCTRRAAAASPAGARAANRTAPRPTSEPCSSRRWPGPDEGRHSLAQESHGCHPARRGWGNGVVRELRQQCSKSRQAARSGTHASAGAHVLIKHTSDVNETVLLVTPARGVQPPASWRLSRTHYCSSS